ncbi:hypothetical protein C9374_009835 [Naegleria lovaniensis]|uniref:DOMON domain-containing protein n=1 Tax=Naegleria lovaniensis TaxID=51637 RepID=A0AA88GCV1_NAELO|nr:uncharacterized protein C9374_009835 [Naegleria lovaniensis]KAG2375212.1 hypothetical protein C9374_009835 [Naegleria lovaniensis]
MMINSFKLNLALLLLALLCGYVSLINAQTYSNCQMFGSHKVEWTLDETNNRLSARFTINNSGGWGAVGMKNPSDGSGMTGATIVLGYGSGNGTINEYYANGNSQPSRLSTNQFTSATSTTSGSTTTMTYVRSLTRPQNAPSTYYALSKGTKTTLLFAAHSSQQPSSPTNFVAHDAYSIFASGIDFFSTSTCGTPKKSNDGQSSVRNGVMSMMIVALVVFMSFMF